MQLLGITAAFVVLMAPLMSSAGQFRNAKCDSTKTVDLINCTSQNLSLSDEALNKNYKEALASIRGKHESKLRNTQRSWLKFRDSYCKSISDEIYPGREAEIEKTACLAHLTGDRATEIERTYKHPNDDQYFQLLSSLERAGYERTELLSKLQNSDSENSEWATYLSVNCDLLKEIHEEPIEKCMARNSLYRSY